MLGSCYFETGIIFKTFFLTIIILYFYAGLLNWKVLHKKQLQLQNVDDVMDVQNISPDLQRFCWLRTKGQWMTRKYLVTDWRTNFFRAAALQLLTFTAPTAFLMASDCGSTPGRFWSTLCRNAGSFITYKR